MTEPGSCIANLSKINNRRLKKLTGGRSCLCNLSSRLREKQFERSTSSFFILKPGNQKFREHFRSTRNIFNKFSLGKERKRKSKIDRFLTLFLCATRSFTILSHQREGWNLQPRPFSRGISRRNFPSEILRGSVPLLRRFQRLHPLVSIKKITAEIPKIPEILGCCEIPTRMSARPTIVPA